MSRLQQPLKGEQVGSMYFDSKDVVTSNRAEMPLGDDPPELASFRRVNNCLSESDAGRDRAATEC